jgi:hypothetical protein
MSISREKVRLSNIHQIYHPSPSTVARQFEQNAADNSTSLFTYVQKSPIESFRRGKNVQSQHE